MQDFGKIIKRLDGSFVINDGLFHVPDNEEFAALFAEVSAYAKAHPDMVETETPPPPPSPEEIKAARMAQIITELDGLDKLSVRALRAEAAGSATQADRERLAGLELKAAGLRAELSSLQEV